MLFEAQAPANLAFIKYMGKASDRVNTPFHPSLSWTLNHLMSAVQLELRKKQKTDIYLPFKDPKQGDLTGQKSILFQGHISVYAQNRFLKHLEYLKSQFGLKQTFIVRSQNNFPSDAGLASSASSFAALTKAFAKALKALTGQQLTPTQCACLSRRGSGSSCRSFFSGCLWLPDGRIFPITFPQNWVHTVILVSQEKKAVSSSKAHKMVLTSPLYKKRPQRARRRLLDFMLQLKYKDWRGLYRVAQAEFRDMMDLFHTSSPSFSYLTANTITVLNIVNRLWQNNKDGPLVTMDAGPHVHLIWREDQRHLMSQIKTLGLKSFPVLASPSCQDVFKSLLWE